MNVNYWIFFNYRGFIADHGFISEKLQEEFKVWKLVYY